MVLKSLIQVTFVSAVSISSIVQAQPGPGPVMRPPPSVSNAPHGAATRPLPGNPIAQLPRGAQEITHQSRAVFHHNGEFFVRQGDGFRTIAAPMGIVLQRIPKKAKRVARNIYRFNGVFYEKTGLNRYQVINAP